MQFTINRDILLKPLQLVTAIIERRQTIPILANVCLNLKNNTLVLLGTDMEIELLGRISLDDVDAEGIITAPARKLLDICKSLSEKSLLKFQQKDDRLILQCGRSRFNLATLPATDFPFSENICEEQEHYLRFTLSQNKLLTLIKTTNFAMAQQDVRYYLNGMLWELDSGSLRTVATDGHRLATNYKDLISYTTNSSQNAITSNNNQFIVPRKAVYELERLLNNDEENEVTVFFRKNQLCVNTQDYSFTSKLIDGNFPSYDRVIPHSGDKILIMDRDLLKAALMRVGILCNDRHRGVCLELQTKELRVFANNLNQEDAEEILEVDYSGGAITIVFNINYLIDVLNSLPTGLVKMTLTTTDASARLESIEENNSIYVVMPMRL